MTQARTAPKTVSIFYFTVPEACIELFSYDSNTGFKQYYFQIRFTYDQEWNDASNLFTDPIICAIDAAETFMYLVRKHRGDD